MIFAAQKFRSKVNWFEQRAPGGLADKTVKKTAATTCVISLLSDNYEVVTESRLTASSTKNMSLPIFLTICDPHL